MNTKIPSRRVPPVLREDDIRAYAAHLFEQSGRIPNRDIENWLEAKACLERNLASAAGTPRRGAPSAGRRARGFTMPASDASLWIDEEEPGSAEA